MSVRFHRLDRSDFDELAAGRARDDLVHRLRVAQLSRRLLLLRAVMDDAARLAPDGAGRCGLAHSYGILAAAQRASPDVVAELLLSPGFGLWAMHCLRRLRGTVSSPGPVAGDLAGLGSLAVVAALQAGIDAELTLFAPQGEVFLPTLGCQRGELSGWIRARTTCGKLILRPFDARPDDAGAITISPLPSSDGQTVESVGSMGWHSVPALHGEAAGERIDLRLDFLDPGRHNLGLPVSGDVEPDLVEQWQHRLDEGWRVLARRDPLAARALSAAITTIFPLRATADTTELSASAGEAFGAVAMTLPKDGLSCAAALLHEFQHNKLSALLDLVTLCEPADGRLFYAPWRADPRPLGGLLQGAYAYLGLIGFWDDERRENRENDFAHFEFARWREEVWRVLITMRISGAMTPLGLRFIDGMQAAAWPHRLAAVPEEPRWLAARISAETRLAWRLRNLEPAVDQVASLARAWLAGRPAPRGLRVPTRVRTGPRALPRSAQLELAHFRLREPKAFQAARDGVPGVLGGDVPISDQAHAFGDLLSALAGYRVRIVDDPSRLDAWSGLALWAWEDGATEVRALATAPEVILALHREIAERAGYRPDPVDLTTWVGASPSPPTSAGL
ncbi:HEXXH motif domain-containing protein [Frankia sp. AiPs1]|uniref:HEXXH motif domain-containing protein n=1 Tax=Frankia sp. AiPa1 TaxID=573492 RepID=UPI00202B04D3|nr:HEXXH motif domain-containing protein [Frankia sp. AiPa1]MCL9758224.1 HEXXH motif domain-containing protein [Frankia sp. AiPa1]